MRTRMVHSTTWLLRRTPLGLIAAGAPARETPLWELVRRRISHRARRHARAWRRGQPRRDDLLISPSHRRLSPIGVRRLLRLPRDGRGRPWPWRDARRWSGLPG